MGRIVPVGFIQWFSGKIGRHSHTSIVLNKTTGHMHTRDNSNMGKRPPTVAQRACREQLKQRSQMAAAWMKANNAEAHPPCGTEEWQRIMHQFKKQNKIGYPLQHVMSRIDKDGMVV